MFFLRVCCDLQASAADYFEYSSHLAAWGFAVLAYDFNLLSGLAAASSFLHTDEAEVRGTGWQGPGRPAKGLHDACKGMQRCCRCCHKLDCQT
jgi:hypothetical protein